MNEIRTIKIFEDRQIKLNLSSQEEKDILSLKKIIGYNNLNLQADGKLLVMHYVGFVQINNIRLLIYPKIASRYHEDKDYEKPFEILIKLLSNSKFFNVKRIPNPQMMGRYNSDLLELFISFFADELLLLLKKDVNKGYNLILENQSFIKGKIDFVETIKRNNFRRHLHYVHYDNFSEDTLLNQIFKSVIINLIKKTKIQENKMKLKQIMLWLEDVTPVNLNNEIWKKVKFSPLNQSYEPVYNLAKLFYYNSSPSLNKGDELTFSFLVPLNQLFERYLYDTIELNKTKDINFKYQGPISYLAMQNDAKIMQLKPDITILDNDKVKYIIDAKYKEVDILDGKPKVLQSDIYQMIAYSIRYECNNIALVYPKFLGDSEENIVLSEISIDNYDKQINIILLKIDLEKNRKSLSDELLEILFK